MKKLGDLLLPDSLQWSDRYSQPPLTQKVVQTLAGTPVISVYPRMSGWSITLLAEEEVTWLDQQSVEILLAMASTGAALFPFVWEALSCTVCFRHQDPPALQIKPLWAHHNQYIGTIKLMVC